MKVLLVTPNNLAEGNGGGIGAMKFCLALRSMDVKLYIYSPNKLEDSYVIADKNKKNDISSRLYGHSNYLFMDWKLNKEKIYNLKPDIVILTNSRLGFIAKDIALNSPNTKIIVHLDNVEYDYCDNYFKKYSGIKRMLGLKIEKACVKRDEALSFNYSDEIIFLTERDKNRTENLYKYSGKYEYIPACLERKELKFKPSTEKMNLVFLSSLWYKPNEEGIIWFIENVWKDYLSQQFNLIIGGKSPSEQLMKYDKSDNINIFANFESIEDIVPKNSIFIAPIFEGAGMKVKVAEALSMGFPIVATDEALIGYEKVFSDINKSVYKANTKDDFIEKIKYIAENYNSQQINDNALYLFNSYYSIDTCRNTLTKIIEEMNF